MELTHDDEKNGEDDEAHKLDGLATPGVNEKESNPVAGDQSCNGQDQVTNTNIFQVVVNGLGTLGGRATETNGLKDDAGVKTKTVIGNLKGFEEKEIPTSEDKLTSRANQE